MCSSVRSSRRQLASVIIVLAMAWGLLGCSRLTYRAPHKVQSYRQIEYDLHFFLWGLIGEEHVWAGRDCGAPGVAKIFSRETPLDTVLTLITLGLYAPRTTTVTCAVDTFGERGR